MWRVGLGLIVLAATPAVAQTDQSIPAALPKNGSGRTWNAEYTTKPGSSCSAENGRCTGFCVSRPSQYRVLCLDDCEQRLGYCKSSGYYPWVDAKSIKVDSRN